jgi:hypothetical protein
MSYPKFSQAPRGKEPGGCRRAAVALGLVSQYVSVGGP